MEPIIVIFLAIIFVMLLKLSGKSKKAKLIDKLPGPAGVPILGNALQLTGLDRAARVKLLMRRDKQCGPIYRNWNGFCPYVYISSGKLAEVVLQLKNVQNGQNLHSRSGYEFLPWFNSLIANETVKTFRNSSLSLVESFRKFSDTYETTDVYPLLKVTVLGAVYETVTGQQLGHSSADLAYIKATDEISELREYRNKNVWLHNDWVWALSAAGRKAKKAARVLQNFTEPTVRDKRIMREIDRKECQSDTRDNKRRTVLDGLLDEIENRGIALTDENVCGEVNSFVIEICESITSVLHSILLMLDKHQDIQRLAYREQLDIFGTSSVKAASKQDLDKMELLDQVIKESLRMFPPVPFITRTLMEDVTLGGYVIPRGSVAVVSLASILRNPKYFSRPRRFEPSRFMEENSGGRRLYTNLLFGVGPKSYLDKNFLMVGAKIFLSDVVRNYHVESQRSSTEILQDSIGSTTIKLHTRCDGALQ